MKTYKAKTTFPGYKIGLSNPDPYIGVPAGKGYTLASYNGVAITLQVPVTSKTFQDKYGRGKYTLEYFPIPLAKEEKIEEKEEIKELVEDLRLF
jgi:hypothetical protein